MDAAKSAGIAKSRIFLDKESGKDFNRDQWRALMEILKPGDVLFVKSLDRIGRNYKEILRVWQTLTKDKDVDVVVLDMSILDTRRDKNLLGTFIADLVLQVLSFVAENERLNIRERQREGIAAARARGVRLGRPALPIPPNFEHYATKYLNGEILANYAAKACGMSETTFVTKAKQRLNLKKKRFKKVLPPRVLPTNCPDAERFDEIAKKWFDGEFSAQTAAEKIGVCKHVFYKYANKRFPHRKATYRARGPRFEINEQFKTAALFWFEGLTTTKEEAYRFDMSDKTFIKLASLVYPEKRRKMRYSIPNPPNFDEIVKRWLNGEIKQKKAAELCNMTPHTFARRAQILNYF